MSTLVSWFYPDVDHIQRMTFTWHTDKPSVCRCRSVLDSSTSDKSFVQTENPQRLRMNSLYFLCAWTAFSLHKWKKRVTIKCVLFITVSRLSVLSQHVDHYYIFYHIFCFTDLIWVEYRSANMKDSIRNQDKELGWYSIVYTTVFWFPLQLAYPGFIQISETRIRRLHTQNLDTPKTWSQVEI